MDGAGYDRKGMKDKAGQTAKSVRKISCLIRGGGSEGNRRAKKSERARP